MIIRKLNEQEILPALHLVWEVFAEDVAPQISPEGVKAFQKLITYGEIYPQIQNGEVVLFGAFEGSQICGVSGLHVRNGGRISLLYVRRNRRRLGVGRRLYEEMCRCCLHELKRSYIGVNAFPQVVGYFQKLGMHPVSGEQCVSGVPFVSMEALVPVTLPEKKKSNKRPIMIGAIAIGGVLLLLLLILVGILFGKIGGAIVEWGAAMPGTYKTPYEESIQQTPFYYDSEEDNEEGENGLNGIDAIPVYEQNRLAYEVLEESYIEQPEDTTSIAIQFEIYYPQVSGLEASVQNMVNKALKECAMETVEALYLNPDLDTKEKVLTEEYPVLASYVNYKVTYLSENLMSVVYEDYCYEGSEYDYGMKFRTMNINLKDGTIYEVKDIVELSDSFIREWLEEMRDEAEEDRLLSELNVEQMKKCLAGEDETGIYTENFFLDAEGLEIGFGFNYEEEDEHNLGFAWVTAPFDQEDIRSYRTDSEFWNLVSWN